MNLTDEQRYAFETIEDTGDTHGLTWLVEQTVHGHINAILQTLEAHEPCWHGTGYGGGRMGCRCGDDCPDGYTAHVTAVGVSR